MNNIDKIKEKILKEIDFLSDHWVNGDDKPPFSFGGWREEVAESILSIFSELLKQQDYDHEILVNTILDTKNAELLKEKEQVYNRSTTGSTILEEIDELVRDLTKVCPMPKSEVRRRIKDLLLKERGDGCSFESEGYKYKTCNYSEETGKCIECGKMVGKETADNRDKTRPLSDLEEKNIVDIGNEALNDVLSLTDNKQEEWEKSWNNRFEWFRRKDSIQFKTIDCWSLDDEIKEFIRDLRSKDRDTLVERIEEELPRRIDGEGDRWYSQEDLDSVKQIILKTLK